MEGAGVRFVVTSQGLDLKPGGDAISRLLLTVLAAVAEFELDLLRERSRLGLAKARREGKRLGRPPKVSLPPCARVLALRRLGRSWREVSATLNCKTWAARKVAAA